MKDDASTYLRWLEARDGDAFASLAHRHASLVIDVALRVGVDRGVAEDALQEALLALARDGTARPATVGVRAWLARAALSRALNARASERSRRRRERKRGRARTETTMDADRVDAREAVDRALQQCGGEDAAVLSLRFIHELGYAELASVLGVAEATARVRVHRALGRLRKEARRDELDDHAIATLVAAIPPYTAPAGVVERALASALARAEAATGAVATTARTGAALARRLGIPVAVVLTLGLGLVVWHAARPGTSRLAPTRSDGADARALPPGATLRGRAGPPQRPDAGAGAGPLPGAPRSGAAPKGPVVPRPKRATASARAADARSTPVDVRMELVRPDSRTAPILDFRLAHLGFEYTGADLRDHPGLLRTRAGERLMLSTGDPRAAIRSVILTVPDPVPSVLTGRVPETGDPRLGRLTLHVVDAETGLPLPGARLEQGGGAGGASLPADANGHIVVARPGSTPPDTADAPALWQFMNTAHYVHAPGYHGVGFTDRLGGKEFVLGVGAEVLSKWLETGIRRIALPPLPDVPGLEERWIRIVDSSGRPAEGVFVYVVWPVPTKLPTWPEAFDGFRRTGADGLLRLAIKDVIGIEARIDRVPVAAWGLAKSDWPRTGPREVRMPPVATAELVLVGLPPGRNGYWRRDPLGAKRTPEDGPAFPPTLDPEAARILAARETMLPVWLRDAGGTLGTPRTTIRMPLAVGRAHTLYLGVNGEHRTLTVHPDAAGPLHLVRRWADLPLAP